MLVNTLKKPSVYPVSRSVSLGEIRAIYNEMRRFLDTVLILFVLWLPDSSVTSVQSVTALLRVAP